MSCIANYINNMSKWQKSLCLILAGAIVGLGVLFVYVLRAHTFLGDDSSACINCHIMNPYYATWFHSSHSRNATCNDCHVPHENFVQKYAFKGVDGMKHVAMLLTNNIRQAPEAEEPSRQVIMNNCIRCHNELNTTLVKVGQLDYMKTAVGEGKACWDCHRKIPHGGKVSLAASPEAILPNPPSPAPDWLKKMLGN